jgi:H+/Cl- antiporter ClcA
MWQSFVSAMVAAVTLQAMNPFRTGKLVLYQVTYSSGWHGFEMAPFAILGVIGVSRSKLRQANTTPMLIEISRAYTEAFSLN